MDIFMQLVLGGLVTLSLTAIGYVVKTKTEAIVAQMVRIETAVIASSQGVQHALRVAAATQLLMVKQLHAHDLTVTGVNEVFAGKDLPETVLDLKRKCEQLQDGIEDVRRELLEAPP